jgi:hypothetical protein
MRRILISIPTGFQLRQFVHSSVLDLLLEHGVQALIVSPNRDGEGFLTELPARGVDVRCLDLTIGSVRHRYLAARQHLLFDGPMTSTLREIMTNLKRTYPCVARGARVGNRLLRRFPRLRQRVLRWERLILRDKLVDELLTHEQIDLVLLTTPGFAALDTVLLHAAVRRGIPTVAAVLSWDNTSTKCVINPQPDALLVWSDHMRREAIRLGGMPAERVIVTGPPHYDAFANAGRFGSRSENFKCLGLDPERRLLVYGTSHAGFFPDEIEVVKRVAQWVENDALGYPCQLWVRFHPLAVTGPYRVLTDQYRGLASERVTVELPPVCDSQLRWELPKSDLEHLVRLMRDADVVINTASTLSLDAAIFDRPVVCVAYDPAGDLPYDKSVRRYYDYVHMAHVVGAGAVQLARSADELRRKIVAYLERPVLDREGRQRIVEQQFGRVDGGSAARLVDQVLATAQQGARHD